MHHYLLINSDFIFALEHNNPIAVQDNPITWEYLVDAMSNYLANFAPSPAAPTNAAPPALDADAPAPPAIDNPPTAAAALSFCHPSLFDFWSSS